MSEKSPIPKEAITKIVALNDAMGDAKTDESLGVLAAEFEALWWKVRKAVKVKRSQPIAG